MNKEREALQKIVKILAEENWCASSPSTIAYNLATEALQSESEQPKSESRMYSEEEMNKCWIQATRKTLEPLTEIGFTSFLQSLKPKTEESRMYTEEEMRWSFDVGYDYRTSLNDDIIIEFGKHSAQTFESFLKPLKPKTEEVERGWTITDKTLIDRQLEAIKTVMSNIKTKEQAIQFLKDAGIELEEEQPTSPSIEKTAEEILRDACPVLFKPNTDVRKAIITAMEEYAQLKANNSLVELEKWVNDSTNGISVSLHDLRKKIQELKP